MTWNKLSKICKNKESDENSTLLKTSIESNHNKHICSSTDLVFPIEEWKKINNIEAHIVDALHVEINKDHDQLKTVKLVEFKGGKTIYDWVDKKSYQPTIHLKALDTLVCVLPRLLDAKEYLKMYQDNCSLEYIICVSPDNSIINTTINDNCSIVRSRVGAVEIKGKSEEYKILANLLRRYSQGVPFDKIIICDATGFSVRDNPIGFFKQIR